MVNEETISQKPGNKSALGETENIDFLLKQLEDYYQNYLLHGLPIQMHTFLAKLYKNRRKIQVDDTKKPLFLSTSLWKMGLGWYWLRDMDCESLIPMSKKVRENQCPEAREAIDEKLAAIFCKYVKEEDWDNVFQMLVEEPPEMKIENEELFIKLSSPQYFTCIFELIKENDTDVYNTVRELFLKTVKPQHKSLLIEMMRESSGIACSITKDAFLKAISKKDKELVLELLRSDNPSLKQAAREALPVVATSEDLELLVKLIRDKDKTVHWAAKDTFPRVVKREDWNYIVNLLCDKNLYVRWAARDALVNIVNREDLGELKRMLLDENSNVRKAASQAFGKIVEPAHREIIMEMLNEAFDNNVTEKINSDKILKDFKKTALESFLKVVDSGDGEIIKKLQNDNDKFAGEIAKLALIKTFDGKNRTFLHEMTEDESSIVRLSALEKLGENIIPEERDIFLKLLEDENEEIIKAAGKAMEKIMEKEETSSLVKLADESKGTIVKALANIIRKHAAKGSIVDILHLIRNKNPHIQEAGILALMETADPIKNETLPDLLADEANGWSKRHIAFFKALRKIDEKFYCPI